VADLQFSVEDMVAERYALTPLLNLRLRITESTGARVHAMALRCQIRIEPFRRSYDADEGDRLADLFGERVRWGDTLKPMQLCTVESMVPGFRGSLDTTLQVPCTYDTEIASAKYFHSLRGGEIPLLMLFSGTVFVEGGNGFFVEQVPWDREANYRLPVKVWRDLMDLHFPGTGWLTMRIDTLDRLLRFKSQRGLPTWDEAMTMLLKEAGEESDDHD